MAETSHDSDPEAPEPPVPSMQANEGADPHPRLGVGVSAGKRVPLSRSEKVALIFVANVAVVIFVWGSVGLGMSAGDGPPMPAKLPRLSPYYFVGLLVAGVCALALLIPRIFSGASNVPAQASNVPAPPPSHPSPPEDGRTPLSRRVSNAVDIWLDDREIRFRRGDVFLWAITIGSYVAVAVLIIQTGGMIHSPFSTIPAALVLLSPLIMTGNFTPWFNLAGGLLLIVFLYHPIVWTVTYNFMPADRQAVDVSDNVALFGNALIILIGFLFAIKGKGVFIRQRWQSFRNRRRPAAESKSS